MHSSLHELRGRPYGLTERLVAASYKKYTIMRHAASTTNSGKRRRHHEGDGRFSIFAPARGATGCHGLCSPAPCGFNSRAREGRDVAAAALTTLPLEFQFTRPRGARLLAPACRGHAQAFQFTRPRGARHGRHSDMPNPNFVSIHAPARGATLDNALPNHRAGVSIHAPARGATAASTSMSLNASGFQFTRPRGARPAS